MSETHVVLTGTGVPHAAPGRAGAGVMVRHDDTVLQFDAGRGTVLRVIEAGVQPTDITAVFVTHYHSDHVMDLPDVVITHWVQQQMKKTLPLQIVAPAGPATRFVSRMMDAFDDDIHVRREHTGAPDPRFDAISFDAPLTPTEVWRSANGDVKVEAVAVHHEPVEAAVAYRVTTPCGVVVISGDTRACDEVFSMAQGCDVLVHETCRKRSMGQNIKGTVFENIFDYHADSVTVGELAQKYNVKHLVLTHLIPQPRTEEDERKFEADTRAGGYAGQVTVGKDLLTVTIRQG
jgi:ribonuclease Z